MGNDINLLQIRTITGAKNCLLRSVQTVLQIFNFLGRGRFLHRKLTKFGEFVTKNLVTLTTKVYFKS